MRNRRFDTFVFTGFGALALIGLTFGTLPIYNKLGVVNPDGQFGGYIIYLLAGVIICALLGMVPKVYWPHSLTSSLVIIAFAGIMHTFFAYMASTEHGHRFVYGQMFMIIATIASYVASIPSSSENGNGGLITDVPTREEGSNGNILKFEPR